MNLNGTLTFTVAGTSTTGMSVNINPTVKITNASIEDYFHNTYRVNPNTSATPINMGTIVTGKYLFINVNGPITVIITQNATDISFDVTGAFFFSGNFSAVKVANSTSEVREITLLALGVRQLYGANPGVYSAK